jgi:hypothetical protein
VIVVAAVLIVLDVRGRRERQVKLGDLPGPKPGHPCGHGGGVVHHPGGHVERVHRAMPVIARHVALVLPPLVRIPEALEAPLRGEQVLVFDLAPRGLVDDRRRRQRMMDRRYGHDATVYQIRRRYRRRRRLLQLVRCCGSAMLLLDARVVLVLSHLDRYSTRSVKRVTDD